MTCISTLDYNSPAWEALPQVLRQEVRTLLEIFGGVPAAGVTHYLKAQSLAHGMSYATLTRHYYAWKNNGRDWQQIVDKRKAPQVRASLALSRQPVFAAELVRLVNSYKRNHRSAFKDLRKRWTARRKTIPGYETWPGWPQIPAGWSDRNLYRIVQQETNRARLVSIRVGTSSKTNPFLPTVLTTRVGLWPGAVIQLDDVWHDNYVTVGKKREVCRVLELGALDLFSACRFHFGAKPRRRRENGSWETIGGADMRMFIAGMFHRYGYSPQGTMLMSEHNTAKVSEDIARLLYDATGGLIRVDYQPIEGKQAALCGFWNGSEGGNFRAKACLESTHNLIHNDLAALSMQTGSPSSGITGPVTTDRIVSYIQRVMRDVLAKVPHRAELLRLPALDFHHQFYPFLVDYYEFGLNARTDHDLEGWAALGHIVNEYTTIPGSGQFFTEDIFLKLPAPSQLAIREAARQEPAAWSRRRNLSPMEVFERRPQFNFLPPSVLCDIIGQDLAREVTARKGFIEFSDREIAPDPLIYQARYVTGPKAGQEIRHGEKVRLCIFPFDDRTAIATDAAGRFLGELALYKRVLPIDPTAFNTTACFDARPDIHSAEFKRATGEKHSRIAEILEPDRILHREEVAEARELREHNRRVISNEPITEAERRTAGALQAPITAAANRLQAHGSAIDWDNYPAEDSEIHAAWDDLPDDVPLPDAL
jgi:hypothetical protein